jgi:hypothetical protein
MYTFTVFSRLFEKQYSAVAETIKAGSSGYARLRVYAPVKSISEKPLLNFKKKRQKLLIIICK